MLWHPRRYGVRELYERSRAHGMSPAFLLCSGFAMSTEDKGLLRDSSVAVLGKSFDIDALGSKVYELLNLRGRSVREYRE